MKIIYKKENYSIIDKKFFEEILRDSEKETMYLYHYILVKYKTLKCIKTLKIDQVKDLEKIQKLNVLCKYYIKKIHYYSGKSGNDLLDIYGIPYHIYNVGYFYIGGDISMKKEDNEIARKMFEEYKNNYKDLSFPFTDEEFLSLNESVRNF